MAGTGGPLPLRHRMAIFRDFTQMEFIKRIYDTFLVYLVVAFVQLSKDNEFTTIFK